MTGDQFRKFCIVGMGGHARTKLIPAIQSNGQQVTAVVSSQPAKNFPDVAVFPRLEDAVDKLPRDTTFFIATPPALHFKQARMVLQKGFDLFMEKPAFLTRREAEEIALLCEGRPVVLVEGFMHRYTRLYSELLKVWTSSPGRVRRIEIKFLIDKMPAGTFRSETQIASSGIFDIGCYPVSLLYDLGLGRPNLEVAEVHFAENPDKMRIRITGSAGQIDIDIDIGIGDAYSNFVCLHLGDSGKISFAPFFYGRSAERSITASSGERAMTETFLDENAFQVMLARPRDAWQRDQTERCVQMMEVAGHLERLIKKVSAASMGSP